MVQLKLNVNNKSCEKMCRSISWFLVPEFLMLFYLIIDAGKSMDMLSTIECLGQKLKSNDFSMFGKLVLCLNKF